MSIDKMWDIVRYKRLGISRNHNVCARGKIYWNFIFGTNPKHYPSKMSGNYDRPTWANLKIKFFINKMVLKHFKLVKSGISRPLYIRIACSVTGLAAAHFFLCEAFSEYHITLGKSQSPRFIRNKLLNRQFCYQDVLAEHFENLLWYLIIVN